MNAVIETIACRQLARVITTCRDTTLSKRQTADEDEQTIRAWVCPDFQQYVTNLPLSRCSIVLFCSCHTIEVSRKRTSSSYHKKDFNCELFSGLSGAGQPKHRTLIASTIIAREHEKIKSIEAVYKSIFTSLLDFAEVRIRRISMHVVKWEPSPHSKYFYILHCRLSRNWGPPRYRKSFWNKLNLSSLLQCKKAYE